MAVQAYTVEKRRAAHNDGSDVMKEIEDGAVLPALQEQAAQLVAAGRLTFPAIARDVGVSERIVQYWCGRVGFRARVDALNNALAQENACAPALSKARPVSPSSTSADVR